MKTIHTLDTRSYVMLEVTQKYFNLDSKTMYTEINKIFDNFIYFLKTKEISYESLKTCLTPSIKKNEMVLVFDRMKIESNWYGNSVFEKIIPIFEKDTSHSILCGDYVGDTNSQDILKCILEESLEVTNIFNYQHSNQFYMVYLNNVSEFMMEKFNSGLKNYNAYVGFINLTYKSHLKTYLALTLAPTVIKYKENILNIVEGYEGYEGGYVPDENLYGYPFEKFGFKCKGIPDDFYGLFLSYKIESEVINSFENDIKYSINSLTDKIIDLRDCKVIIEDSKYTYVHKEKENQLKKAEILTLDKFKLEKAIKDKIFSNYIYNMTYNGHILKFNISIEFFAKKMKKQVKILVSLEYNPNLKSLRLLTMF